jgi:hypothetical protein
MCQDLFSSAGDVYCIALDWTFPQCYARVYLFVAGVVLHLLSESCGYAVLLSITEEAH